MNKIIRILANDHLATVNQYIYQPALHEWRNLISGIILYNFLIFKKLFMF